MKRKIKLILFLLLSLWLTDQLLFSTLDYFYKRVYTGQSGGKINYFLQNKSLSNMVVMGNSRAYNQIIPDSLDSNSYNLGHAGMKQQFQTSLLSIMESNKRLPSTILLHIEPMDYASDKEDVSAQKLKYYYGSDSIVTEYINNISFYERFKFIFKSYRFNGIPLNIIKNFLQTKQDTESTINKGWMPIPKSPVDSINLTKGKANEKNKLAHSFDDKKLSSLLKFIEICKRNNIKLVCFTSPEYYYQQEDDAYSQKIQEVLSANNIKYINFIATPIPELQEKAGLWKDPMHLNENGSKIESKKIAEWLKANK